VVHLDVDGLRRTYRLHLARTTTPQPLVIVLHGASATAREVERRYHWDPLAERRHFVVAYPQGIGRRWDDSGTRDVEFLRAVIADIGQRVSIETHRIYVTGISNGGVMTYRAGCGLADTLAAIGPVAAWFPDCRPPVPVSVIHIHGLDDSVLPFAGGNGSPSVPDGLADWRAADSCGDTATNTQAGQVTHAAWTHCAPGIAIELYTIRNGRHEWPGAIPKPGNDPVSNALDATTTIWTFFEAHPRA
jgi:polyhydroxybutyrate depolymerase